MSWGWRPNGSAGAWVWGWWPPGGCRLIGHPSPLGDPSEAWRPRGGPPSTPAAVLLLSRRRLPPTPPTSGRLPRPTQSAGQANPGPASAWAADTMPAPGAGPRRGVRARGRPPARGCRRRRQPAASWPGSNPSGLARAKSLFLWSSAPGHAIKENAWVSRLTALVVTACPVEGQPGVDSTV